MSDARGRVRGRCGGGTAGGGRLPSRSPSNPNPNPPSLPGSRPSNNVHAGSASAVTQRGPIPCAARASPRAHLAGGGAHDGAARRARRERRPGGAATGDGLLQGRHLDVTLSVGGGGVRQMRQRGGASCGHSALDGAQMTRRQRGPPRPPPLGRIKECGSVAPGARGGRAGRRCQEGEAWTRTGGSDPSNASRAEAAGGGPRPPQDGHPDRTSTKSKTSCVKTLPLIVCPAGLRCMSGAN
eukprot:352361-Chlamydomonas_euryale.AAC.7